MGASEPVTSYTGILPRLNTTTFNSCWLCRDFAKWLQSSQVESYELWSRESVEVTYKCPTILKGEYPWYWFIQRLGGPIVSVIVIVQLSSILKGSNDGGNNLYHGWAVELSSITSTECRGFRDVTTGTQPGGSIDYDIVRQWMKNCERHKTCSMRKVTPNWHPPRLLRISEKGRSVRLVVSTHDDLAEPQERYMTLSHRWGKLKYTKLSRTNISSMQKEIHISSLPQTFQDFFEIAYELGFSLVWIDSLCIMQDDDKEDWKIQCKTMDKVYANAYLNISATSAEDDLSSLYCRERGAYLKPSVLDTSGWLIKQRRFILDGRAWIDEVSEAPLNRRGWVFQERYLARRVLHFGNSQLAWECCELEALEAFPDGLPVTLVPELLSKRELVTTLQTHAFIFPTNLEHGAYSVWRVLIERYSECTLTEQEDKLPALNGLSNFFAEFLHDTYMAGMWKESLLVDLAWHIGEDGPFIVVRQISDPTHYVPSWSWACVNAPVQFPELQFGIHCYHIGEIGWSDSSRNPADHNIRAQVISLKGSLLPFRCDWEDTSPLRLNIGEEFTFALDSFPGLPTAMHLNISIAEFRALSQVWFLPLLTTKYRIHGLILTKSSEIVNRYQRIGCVMLRVCEECADSREQDAVERPSTDSDSGSTLNIQPKKQQLSLTKWRSPQGILWDTNAVYLYHQIMRLRDLQHTIKIF